MFSRALGVESLDPFFRFSKKVRVDRYYVSQPYRKMEVTRNLYDLNLLAKLMVLHLQIHFHLTIAAIAEAILMRMSSEQVPSLHGVTPRYMKLVTFSTPGRS